MPSFVKPRHVVGIEECFFYHSIDIPNYGFVEGASDMRAAVPILLEVVDFRGKDVVDVGQLAAS